ncbi:MAG: tRNA pseudouridine(13) synthase TruD [Pseudomonadota bacterium]
MLTLGSHALGEPGARAMIRETNDDFRVTEVLSFTPSGEGEHVYLEVEKDGITTLEAAQRLARAASVHPKSIGFSGLKDRHAVTSQWFSVQPRGRVDWQQCLLRDMQILRVGRHHRKLKRGAHRENRFQIALRDVSDLSGLEPRLNWLRKNGMPNYFTEQRFGRNGRNIELAKAVFAGRRMRRPERSMAISAARSVIFNRVLSERVDAGNWNQLLPGDVAALDGSGSVFAVAELDDVLEKRVGDLDVHPTGPLWGAGDAMTERWVRETESRCAERYAELAEGLAGVGKMARRALRARVRDLRWRMDDTTLILNFALGKGQYATALLRELAQTTDASRG